jgi:hypothetical protein
MNDDSFKVREGDESDFPGIAELFSRNRWGPGKLEWLQWKYLENPDGRAKIFVAEHANGKIIGVDVHSFRRFTSAKTGAFTLGQPVDNFTAPEMRNKGVYSSILELVESSPYPRIGFPNKLSIRFDPLHPGWKIIAPIEEWVFPVSLGKMIPERIWGYGFLNSLAGWLSRTYALLWLGRKSKRVSMKPISRFDKAFDIDGSFIHGVRSAEYLNWRFINNPTANYVAYEFFEGDESLGYCVYRIEGRLAAMYDFIVSRRWRSCFRALLEKLRQESVAAVWFPSVGLRLWILGFIRLRSVNYVNGYNPLAGPWYLTYCDRDI